MLLVYEDEFLSCEQSCTALGAPRLGHPHRAQIYILKYAMVHSRLTQQSLNQRRRRTRVVSTQQESHVALRQRVVPARDDTVTGMPVH